MALNGIRIAAGMPALILMKFAKTTWRKGKPNSCHAKSKDPELRMHLFGNQFGGPDSPALRASEQVTPNCSLSAKARLFVPPRDCTVEYRVE